MAKENFEMDESKIKEYEEKMTSYYQDRLPFLRIKHEHDMMMADISEARLRNVMADEKFLSYQQQKQDMLDAKNKEVEKKPKDDGGNKS